MNNQKNYLKVEEKMFTLNNLHIAFPFPRNPFIRLLWVLGFGSWLRFIKFKIQYTILNGMPKVRPLFDFCKLQIFCYFSCKCFILSSIFKLKKNYLIPSHNNQGLNKNVNLFLRPMEP